MVYRTVKHRGQWPKSSTPLVMSRSRFLPSRGRLKPLPPWVRLLLQTPGRSSETLLALGTLLGLHLESEQYGV